MKIAVVTDDGVKISPHFGRAPYYVVITIEDGNVVAREQREKAAHGRGHDHSHAAGGTITLDSQPHGFDAAAQETHARMAAAISDCHVLLARGMGMGAYRGLIQAGLEPIITDIATIDEAVAAYLAGTIENHLDRLH
jgi:predicted Fe-Mo cluster-binding NifX family protein